MEDKAEVGTKYCSHQGVMITKMTAKPIPVVIALNPLAIAMTIAITGVNRPLPHWVSVDQRSVVLPVRTPS